jgi:hypothetical protein
MPKASAETRPKLGTAKMADEQPDKGDSSCRRAIREFRPPVINPIRRHRSAELTCLLELRLRSSCRV